MYALRDLEQRRALFALIVLGVPQAQSARIAASAMTRWHAVIAPKGIYQTALYAGGRTSNRKVPVEGIPEGAVWQHLLASLSSCGSFQASCRDDGRADYGYDSDEDPMTVIGHGAHLGMRFSRSQRPPLVFTLELWLDLRDLPASRGEHAARVLREIVDEAMHAHAVIQAAVGRWARPPENGTNAYEQACGITGANLAERAWTERWLRAVTEDALWLGPTLRAELGDDSAVHALAKVEPIADGIRIVPHAPVDLNALEQALARLLPTSADAEAGKRLTPVKRG